MYFCSYKKGYKDETYKVFAYLLLLFALFY